MFFVIDGPFQFTRWTGFGYRLGSMTQTCLRIMAIFLALSCRPDAASAGTSSGGMGAPIRVGVVFDKGGRDDRSFNASAWRGLDRAKHELGVDGKFVEAMDDNAYEPAIRTFARKKFDLIIAIGFSQVEAVSRVAADFPDRRFALVDSVSPRPNVRSLLFGDHEGAFLAGAAAAMKSATGKVGFIGGMDVPLIRRFDMGFKAGARHIRRDAVVVSNFVGVTVDSWNNPPKAKELALAQYNNGVDVIYVAAGASNSGVFDAAGAKSRYAIGTDSNQNAMRPGLILTSILKRIDVAVFQTIADVRDGKFTAGKVEFGVANGGIDYAVDRHNEGVLVPGLRARLDEIKVQIAAGAIKVPDYYIEADRAAWAK
jgi:basic membrane protein A